MEIEKKDEVLKTKTNIGNIKEIYNVINYVVGLEGYPNLISLLTRMSICDKEKFIIKCMEFYLKKQQRNNDK